MISKMLVFGSCALVSTNLLADEPFVRFHLFSIAQSGDLLNVPLDHITRFHQITARRDQAFRYEGSTLTTRPSLWEVFKGSDPTKHVFLYNHGATSNVNQDLMPADGRTTIGRVSRLPSGTSVPLGALDNSPLNADNYDYHLCATNNQPCPSDKRVVNKDNSYDRFMQFGRPGYALYWAQAGDVDLTAPTGRGADGYHTDVTRADLCSGCSTPSGTPGYTNQGAWEANIISFYTGVARNMNARLQPVLTTTPAGLRVWTKLVAAPESDRPDQLMTEFMFTSYPTRTRDFVNFKNGDTFDAMIAAYAATRNVEVISQNCAITDRPTDMPNKNQAGDPISEEIMVHYSLASFLLVRPDTPPYWYFGCDRNTGVDNDTPWFPEYDSILGTDGKGYLNLGPATGGYVRTTEYGSIVHYRLFRDGAVFVNSGRDVDARIDLVSILGEPARIIERANLKDDLEAIPLADNVMIPRMQARFVRLVKKPDPCIAATEVYNSALVTMNGLGCTIPVPEPVITPGTLPVNPDITTP